MQWSNYYSRSFPKTALLNGNNCSQQSLKIFPTLWKKLVWSLFVIRKTQRPASIYKVPVPRSVYAELRAVDLYHPDCFMGERQLRIQDLMRDRNLWSGILCGDLGLFLRGVKSRTKYLAKSEKIKQNWSNQRAFISPFA